MSKHLSAAGTGGQPWLILSTISVGMDVHKESISVASCQGHETEPHHFVGSMGTREADIEKLVGRLQVTASDLVFAYQDGPCGYVL